MPFSNPVALRPRNTYRIRTKFGSASAHSTQTKIPNSKTVQMSFRGGMMNLQITFRGSTT